MIDLEPLKDSIIDSGVSIRYLAKETGMNELVLKDKIERGGCITMENLDKICNVLQRPVSDVIRWTEGTAETHDKVNLNWELICSRIKMMSISMSELSIRCGMERTSLSHSMHRNSGVRRSVVSAIARITGCSEEKLIACGDMEE